MIGGHLYGWERSECTRLYRNGFELHVKDKIFCSHLISKLYTILNYKYLLSHCYSYPHFIYEYKIFLHCSVLCSTSYNITTYIYLYSLRIYDVSILKPYLHSIINLNLTTSNTIFFAVSYLQPEITISEYS